MSFDRVVVQCGAPALCGIKTASLFSMRMDLYADGCEKISGWNRIFRQNGTVILPIQRRDDFMLLFVYNPELIKARFAQKNVRCYLAKKEYPVEEGFDSVLYELVLRLRKFCEFPHEIGIFLGYPLEDVVQFEKRNGKGFCYSGYWKVYKNKNRAVAQMNEYKTCCCRCLEFLEMGMSVPEIAETYRNCCA
ncbi:MAG: DUF3793 family protein [Treponema sp.]